MIGVLAYGSLIPDPGIELASITVARTPGVPTPFFVEYARSSRERAGAPTLVPVTNGGCSVLAVIFTVDASIEDAANILYRREANAVGSGKVYRPPPPDRMDAVRIDYIENLGGHELVLSTRIAPNISPLSADFLAELAIESARKLTDGRDGISYLISARESGIVTPLSPTYEAKILEKTQAADLASALAAIRGNAGPAEPSSNRSGGG